jgi:hypothetical protein
MAQDYRCEEGAKALTAPLYVYFIINTNPIYCSSYTYIGATTYDEALMAISEIKTSFMLYNTFPPKYINDMMTNLSEVKFLEFEWFLNDSNYIYDSTNSE